MELSCYALDNTEHIVLGLCINKISVWQVHGDLAQGILAGIDTIS